MERTCARLDPRRRFGGWTLDVADFVDTQFRNNALPYLVLMADGREVKNGGPFSEELRPAAQARLRRGVEFPRPGTDLSDVTAFASLGMTVTGLPALNAIVSVVAAPPGILTSADLPLRAFGSRFLPGPAA